MDLALDSSKIIYLDNAATTFPKPKEVLEAALDAYTRFGVNPGRSGYDLCLVAGELVETTRRSSTRFFAGPPERLVFAYNATEALNWRSRILESGDHVITTTIEHNSVIRPLNPCARGEVAVEYVPAGSGGSWTPPRSPGGCAQATSWWR
jgi:selenocysteine lyase/cysteine desulfurase